MGGKKELPLPASAEVQAAAEVSAGAASFGSRMVHYLVVLIAHPDLSCLSPLSIVRG